VAAWRQDGGTWARLAVELDDARARDWFAKPRAGAAGEGEGAATMPPPSDARLAELKAQVETWQAAFAGRQFLLPPHKAEGLMRSRNDYLDGTQ
jgi:hypothetical protein